MNRMYSSVAGLLLALSLLPTIRPAEAQTLETIVDLTGEWKFEVGDDPAWSDPKLDDSKWEQLRVPGQWEDQGFPGYDGFAWARKTFRVPASSSGDALYLRIGNVDDADEVYVNGILIGYTGELPPHYEGGYGEYRQYPLAPGLLRWGQENLIAVRIFDGGMGGGIVNGPVCIARDHGALKIQYPLLAANITRAGEQHDPQDGLVWRFRTGDKKEWSDPDLDDRDWKPVLVPLEWDGQGYKEYDGFAWYRVHFRVPDIDPSKPIILVMGKIDDVDEVYLNGSLIGKTGRMPPDWSRGDAYQKLRAYTIPAGRLAPGTRAVLAIRVYDGLIHGGIYDGPIGFVTRDRYVAWSRETRPKTTVLHRLMEFFSGDDSPYEPQPPEPPTQPHHD